MIPKANRMLGTSLLVLAALQAIAVAMNTATRKHGGHDLRPLLLTAALFAVAAFGLIVEARWATILSTSLIAAYGLWIILRDTFILRMPDPLVSIIFGLLLCLPAVLTASNSTTKATV